LALISFVRSTWTHGYLRELQKVRTKSATWWIC